MEEVIIQQICIMFIIVVIGALLYKVKIISDKGAKQLSDVVLKLVCPVLIFMAYQTDYKPELLPGLGVAMFLSCITHIILIITSKLLIRKKTQDSSIEIFSVVYSNCAFMGIPLVGALFGSDGVLYLTAYITFFNIFVWTHGVITMQGTGGIAAIKKAFLSPAIIAVFLGLICFLTQSKLPQIISGALNHIANMNTPLAMIVAGATVARTNILKAAKNPRVLYVTILRLVVLPILLIVIYRFFASKEVFITLSIAAACPVAVTGTLFAVSFGKNSGYASEIFALSTLASAITLPVIVMFSSYIS